MHFLRRAHHILFVLGRLDGTSALSLGAISNSKTTNKKHRNAKEKQHLHTKRTVKQTPICVGGLKPAGAATPSDLRCEGALGSPQGFAHLPTALNDREHGASVDLKVTH